MNDIIPLTYKTIPRILCATDLSPRCESAVRRGTLLAKQMDALLLLVHVVDDAQPQEVIASEMKRARIALEARQLTSAAEIAVRVGRPDRTIARVVGEWDPDLVVLGAYRERPGERLSGTTAERVIFELEHVRCCWSIANHQVPTVTFSSRATLRMRSPGSYA
jgi:nucleotide-binding universal stress UspA family protein